MYILNTEITTNTDVKAYLLVEKLRNKWYARAIWNASLVVSKEREKPKMGQNKN